jgi:hypothetical protein
MVMRVIWVLDGGDVGRRDIIVVTSDLHYGGKKRNRRKDGKRQGKTR